MRVVNLASGTSAWRGYEYYTQSKVISYEQIDEGVYIGKVRGSDKNVYDVTLDVAHPRKTQCNCPFANGKRIVCKHAVALYFAIFPDEAVAYKTQIDKEEEEYENWLEELPDRVINYIHKLNKKELQEQLIDIVLNSEQWILDRYIREHDIDEDS